MYLKDEGKFSTEIAKNLIKNGFRYEDIREIVKNKTPYKGKEIEHFEDSLFKKIETFSRYLCVTNIKTKEKYYYLTVRDLHEDTGLSVNAINASIFKKTRANLMFKVERLSFSTSELCKDKAHLFSKRIGKVKKRDKVVKDGKYISNPLMCIDTRTDERKVYPTAREFCEELNIETKELSKYIINNWRVKSRYRVMPYMKEI